MRVAVSVGSNLGDRQAHLQAAVDSLRPVAVSPVVETDPVGGPVQADYLNAVLLLDLPDDVDLLAVVGSAESARGRTRDVRWGPRTLDVDVLVAGDRVSADPRLTLPHPRAHERAFVLVPWHAVDPTAVLPGHGSVRDLLAALPAAERAGVRPRPDLALRAARP